MRSIWYFLLTCLVTPAAIADTESNNTWQTATQITQDTTLIGTQGDDDWYLIRVTETGVLRILIDVAFSHADGNIQMSLFDDGGVASNPTGAVPGTFRGSSAGDITDHEFLENNVSIRPPGDYYIRLTGENTGNEYSITWSQLKTADDGFEPNNDSMNTSALSANTVVFGSQNDEDWYSIDVAAGSENVIVSLRFKSLGLGTSGDTIDLDLALFDTDGNELASSTNGQGFNESIEFDVGTADTYHLRVSGDNNGDAYALTWIDEATLSSSGSGGSTVSTSSSGALSPALLVAMLLLVAARVSQRFMRSQGDR